MAIKTLLTLEGAEDIKASLADLGKTGEDFVKKLNNLGNSNNPAIQKFVEDVKSASTATTEHGRSIDGLAKLYRLLNPVLKSAGVGLNEFRGFALAARFGIIGLGGAIVTGLVAGLIKLGDSTNETKKRLELMFDSADKGKASFEALKRAAEQFGTTTGSIGPTFEEFQRTLNNFQAQVRSASGGAKFVSTNPNNLPTIQNTKTQEAAFKSFFATLRAGGASEDVANKAMLEFLATVASAGRNVANLKNELEKTTDFAAADQIKKQIRDAGNVTGEFAEKLEKVAPGSLKLFQQALNRTGQTNAEFIAGLDRDPASLDKLINGLARIEPATKQAFDTRPIKPFSESLSELRSKAVRDVQDVQESVEQFKTVPTDIGGVFSDISIEGQASFDSLKQIFSQNPLDTSTWTSDFFNFSSSIETKAQTTWDKIKAIFSQPLSLSFASEGVPAIGGFATGGLFRGRPGRDTNLAWLTDREYILRPEATRYWGVNVLNALNAMKNPFEGFSTGGLFRSMKSSIPAFASGGLNVGSTPSGNPVTIVFGNERFNVSASEDVAARLIRFGRKRNFASAGKAPSRVGRR